MSSTDLVVRYLQAVGLWLPRGTKDDILAEISEDLHSQIEDRAASLNRPLNDTEIAEILKQRGHPVVVASAYLPQQSLIGPLFFPSYKMTLKIVFFCYVIPWLLFCAFPLIFPPHQSGAPWASALAHSLLPLWFSALNTVAIITVVFCALDRGWLRARFARDWNPNRLPKVRAARSAEPRGRAADIAGIVFGLFWLGWLLAVPEFPYLMLGPAAYFVKAAPVWRIVFPIMLILAVAGIVEAFVNIVANLPSWERPVFRFLTSCVTLWVAWILIHAQTYFVAVSQQMQQYASITNLIAYICVRGTALGLAIGLIVQAWKVVQELRRPSTPVVTRMA